MADGTATTKVVASIAVNVPYVKAGQGYKRDKRIGVRRYGATVDFNAPDGKPWTTGEAEVMALLSVLTLFDLEFREPPAENFPPAVISNGLVNVRIGGQLA